MKRNTAPDLPAGDGIAVTEVGEAFLTGVREDAKISALTTWLTPEGDVWVIGSARQAGTLLIFDGSSGELLHETNDTPILSHPSGLTAFGDTLFVVEHQAARVQLLSLPEFISLGELGEHHLGAPTGIWLRESAPGELEAYITDSYQSEAGDTGLDSLDKRIRRFRVRPNEDPIRAWTIGAYGGTDEDSALRRVKAILGDAVFNRLAIAEEHPDFASHGALIYTLDGQYTGEHLGEGLFQGAAKGIALYECPGGSGYWVVVDEGPGVSRFHVFDRIGLDYLGSFNGRNVHDISGITLYSSASQRFPYGVLYVAHDDRGLAAFDWRDIASALNLTLDCPE